MRPDLELVSLGGVIGYHERATTMKTSAQIFVLRALGTFVIGTFILIMAAVMTPGVIASLPRLMCIALFYGGGYLFTWLFTSGTSPQA